jgi:GNAT superfamily N-acetyltransferase
MNHKVIALRVNADSILELRHRILREGLPIETAHFDGDQDPKTWHLAAFIVGNDGGLANGPVSCASFMPNMFGDMLGWQLRGMATDPSHRGTGIGSFLIQFAHERLARQGMRFFWCNARVPAIKFYEKHGWQCVSEIFEIPTAGTHRKMVYRHPD